mmetsp:Transcript_27530/g.77121  ORF Transcript_27530/g.77121 Transcript_27530/m.77121 type:complete len:239 (-) Transcript_27530:238-954(-)
MFGKVSFSILQRTAKLVERGLLRRDVRIIHQALSLHPAGDGRKVSNATMPEKELHLAFPRLTLSSHNMQSFCAVPFQAPPTRPAFGMRQTSPHIVWVHLAHLAYLSPLHKLVQSLAKLDGLLFGGEDLRVQVTVRRLQGVVPLEDGLNVLEVVRVSLARLLQEGLEFLQPGELSQQLVFSCLLPLELCHERQPLDLLNLSQLHLLNRLAIRAYTLGVVVMQEFVKLAHLLLDCLLLCR